MTVVRILDIENNNVEYLGHKAGSPYCPDNYIVQIAWRDDVLGSHYGEITGRRFANKEAARAPGWFDLSGVDILVCHNSQHELSYFFAQYYDEIMKFLRRGGRVLDTAIGHYLLSHQCDLYPSLDEIAPVYGGDHKVSGIKILWNQGVLTKDIDQDLLWEYLAGPKGDVANTALCFYGQMAQLQQQGMWRSYLERCEGMVAFTMCEFNGLYVNLPVAEQNLADQQAELAEIEEEIKHLLPDDMPEELEFNWGSGPQMSALLYGGGVKYKRRVPYDPPRYEKADFYKFRDGQLVLAHTLDTNDLAYWDQHPGNMGVVRYVSGKNKGLAKVFREDTHVEKLKLDDAVFQFPGLIKIRTLPEVLRSKFDNPARGRKGDWVGNRVLADGTPEYSTKSETLEALAKHGLEAADKLVRRNELTKDLGTYYRAVEYNKDGSVKKTKGMLQFVGNDSIIHHSLNVTSTVTGRLSSSRPNLQNLPRDGTSKVKQMFSSRFGDEGRIIEVDYSALEVVMLAALSGDDKLLQELLNGTDMHCLRLAAKEGMAYEEVYERCHNHEHPDHKVWKQKRTDIKPVAFSAQYGASAKGIAYSTGVSEQYAEQFLKAEAELFPQSIAFRDVMLKQVQQTGQHCIQREVKADGSWGVYHRGYWQAPGGTCYSFRTLPQWRDGKEIMDYKATQISNYGIQGEAGFLMTLSAGRVMRWLLSKEFFANSVYPKGRAYLINNVHDALYFDVHESVVREVGLGAKAIMEDAPKYMSKHLGYNISHVPFPAVAEAGDSMYSKTEIH